jgi:hypothetical protein
MVDSTIRQASNYTDGIPGPTDRLLYEDTGGQPHGVSFTSLPEVVAGGVSGLMAGADKSKLNGIEANATADQTAAEIEAAYNAQVPVMTQAEAEAGTSTLVRRVTAQRVAQAIAALGGGGSMTAAEILAELLTVDGPGSGLNADLLDGIGGSGYATAANPVFTGSVTIPDGALAIADTSGLQTALDGKHPLLMVDVEKTASFTFALTDAQKMARCNHATVPITATVPTNASVAFALGTVLNVVQWGAAAVTIAAAGGVTVNKAASKTMVLAERYGTVSLWKQATDTWLLFGGLTEV